MARYAHDWLHDSLLVCQLATEVLALHDDVAQITLAFNSGTARRYDRVVCADGGHGSSFHWLRRGAADYAGYV